MATEARTVVKEVQHAKLYSDGTIFVGPVRASYLHAFKPYRGQNDTGDGKYGIVGLMPKTKEYFPAKDLIKERIQQMVRENKLKDLPAANKFLRDGDLTAREEYERMFTINASEVRQPLLRDRQRDPKTNKPRVLTAEKDQDRLYSGCWVNILIRPWFQNNQFGKKVNAGLVAVQFVDDDEPFGTGRVSEESVDETFDEYASEEGSSGYDDGLDGGDEL